jgi:hypothetical protein
MKNSIDLLLCYNGFEASEKEQAEEQCKYLVDSLTAQLESDSLSPQNMLKERWCKFYSKMIVILDTRSYIPPKYLLTHHAADKI